MSKKRPTVNLVAFDHTTKIISYAWRMWWHSSSFDICPRYAPLSGVKVSLHGPDEFHETSGFKIAIDRAAMVGAQEAGGFAHSPAGGVWFPGREMVPGVKHVLTLRWTPGLFRKGRPNGPNPDDLKPGSFGHVIEAPKETYASDVDIYVCQDKPWWREEEQARKDNACLGALQNAAGHDLTGVSTRKPLRLKHTPAAARLPSPLSRKDLVRAIGTAVDDEGVLFMVEQWTSAKRLQAAAEINSTRTSST